MGILGELNQMAKTGRIEHLNALLSVEMNSPHTDCADIATSIGLNDPRSAGVHRRAVHHSEEISIASFR